MHAKYLIKNRARKRVLTVIFLTVLVVATASISFFIYTQSRQITNTFLLSRASIAAAAFDHDDFSSLSLTLADEHNRMYLRLKNKMMRMKEANPDVEFFYIMKLVNDEVIFVVDSEPIGSDDESPPGQVYSEASESAFKAFESFVPFLTPPETDRWGTWITTFAPIITDEGIEYVLGVDMDADQYATLPFFYTLIPSLLLIVVLILGIVVFYVRRKELDLVAKKTNFVSVASHELRSPLSGIRWAAEMLQQDKTISKKSQGTVKNIHASVLKLIYIISELLDLSAYETGKIKPKDFSKIDVVKTLKEAITNTLITAKSRSVLIKISGDKDPIYIRGDNGKLLNAFNNIVSNAVKYSHDHNKVEIEISKNEKEVYIRVDDHGIGIPEKDIDKIATGFYRSDNAQTHTMDGTGIGLYVTQYAIESHKGSLDISSTEGVGTSVLITLPIAHKK